MHGEWPCWPPNPESSGRQPWKRSAREDLPGRHARRADLRRTISPSLNTPDSIGSPTRPAVDRLQAFSVTGPVHKLGVLCKCVVFEAFLPRSLAVGRHILSFIGVAGRARRDVCQGSRDGDLSFSAAGVELATFVSKWKDLSCPRYVNPPASGPGRRVSSSASRKSQVRRSLAARGTFMQYVLRMSAL